MAYSQLKTYVGAEWGLPGLLTSFGARTLPKRENSQEERSLELDFGAELGCFGDANDELVILSRNDAGMLTRMGTGIRLMEGCSTGPTQRQSIVNLRLSPISANAAQPMAETCPQTRQICRKLSNFH